MHKYLFFLAFSFLPLSDMHAQCFASSGNPVGGTENMGVLSRNMLRLSTFYRFAWSARYFNGSQLYEGEKGILQNANYNYTGFLTGYGLT